RLHSAVSGLGTNDNQLIRILVSRSEVDLPAISAAYQSRHGQELKEAVKSDTSGDYGKVLIKIIEKAGTGAKAGNKKIAKQEPKREKKAAAEKKDKPKDAMASGRREEKEKSKETSNPRDNGSKEKKADKQDSKKADKQDSKKADKQDSKKADKQDSKKADKQDSKKADNQDSKKAEKKGEEKKPKEEEDAVKLFNAMKGIGTDEDTIIEVITRNSNPQRQKLRERYQTLYKEDLLKDLKSETSGDFEEVLEALMLPPVEFDAFSLHKAMKGLGTDETALIGIICSKTPAELEEIKKVYKRDYKEELESAIKKETSGDFRDLLVHHLSSKAGKGDNVDKDKAEKDARALHDVPTSHEVKALFLESPAQIAATSKAHMELFNQDIEFSIKKATSGDAEKAYLATLKSQEDLTEFHARQLESAVSGLGTNDTMLVWTLVSRSEIDLPGIKGHYQRLFGRPLREDVQKDTSGDYGKTLLKIIDKAGDEKSKKNEEKSPRPLGKSNKENSKKDASRDEEKSRNEKSKKKEEKGAGGKSPRAKAATQSNTRSARGKEDVASNKKEEEKREKNAQGTKVTKEDEDATKLYKAMKGIGTDEDALVEVIVRNSNSERQTVRKRYQELYKQDLLKDIKSETSGDFEEVLEALMLPPVEFDAFSLHKAMKGLGTDETALIGIICSKTPAQLDEIKKTFKKTYEKDLEKEVEKETSGQLKDLLLKLLSAKPSKGDSVDKKKADTDAKLLHETPSKDIVTRIFITSSSDQVLATASAHKNFYGEDIAESIKKACSGDEEKAYIAYTGALQNLTTFYAERLHSSMEGIGTKETQLTRILVSTSENDLPATKGKYKSLYGQPLTEAVKKETSGDYRKVLLALLNKVGEVKAEEKPATDRAKSDSNRGVEEDAIRIYKAMHRVGTEEDVVVDIVCKLSNAQRQELKKRYSELYKQDLEKDLRSELTGDFEDTILSLMIPAEDYDARCLQEAMKGLGTDETTLIGIVCSKNPAELETLRASYKKASGRELETDISAETSGDLRELLLALATGKRDKSTRVDKNLAQEDAKSAHSNSSAGNLRRILVSNSTAQAQATIQAYQELYKEDITELIKKATTGDVEKAYVAVVKALQDESSFYADRIHTALKGAGTNETQLTRIIIARSEIDLPAIKKKYSQLFGSSLKKDVSSDTSGDYRRALLRLLDHWGGPELPEDKPKPAGKPEKRSRR
ncbi:hypothetical protein EGW08_001554, partial [Elysia chlorotica]